MQWLDEIPTDEVFALSNTYLQEAASTSHDNTDSGANGTQETEVYDSDSIFEVRSAQRKTIAEGLRLSVSSLSSVSSLQLGEEAGSSYTDEAQENTLQVHSAEGFKSRKTSKRSKSTSSSHLKEPVNRRNVVKTPIQNIPRKTLIQKMPTISKVVPIIPPIVNPQKIEPCRLKRKRKNSANSVAILAKYKLKQDRKAAITITLLIALFFIFKIPYALALLGNAFRGEYWASVHVYETVTWLYWIKSVTNPFVYAFISKRFRLYCNKLFQRTKALCCRTSYTFY